MSSAAKSTIQPCVRLSESKLWEIQKRYFEIMGIEAWEDDVPFYITNNMFIAHQYAHLIYQFMLDYQSLNGDNQKFTILELGCGTGRFSFYFLKCLNEIMTENGKSFDFLHILSDVSDKTIEFCKNNISFKPYIEKNQLDFTFFDVEQDDDFHLQLLDKPYSEVNHGPLMVISNYIFDCTQHDFLQYKKDQYYELKFGLGSRYKKFDLDEPRYLNELRFEFEEEAIDVNEYFDDPIIPEVLSSYEETLKDKESMIPIPLAGFKFLNNMKTLTQNKLFLILGDKGVTQLDVLYHLPKSYRMTFEGCYTFMLNFFMLSDYIKKIGGDCLLSQKSSDFNVSLFSLGQNFSALPRTKDLFLNTCEGLGPQEYASLYDATIQNAYRYNIKSLSAFIKASHWDPEAYAIIHNRTAEIVPLLLPHERIELKSDLKRIESNIYRLDMGFEVSTLLGIFYNSQKNNKKALELFSLSKEIFPKSDSSYQNTANIYEADKDYEKAAAEFRKAYELNPRNAFAKRKMQLLQSNKFPALVGPLFRLFIVVGVIGLMVLFLMK